MNKLVVKNIEINITGIGDDDYISLTDIARMKNPEFPREVIKNWMRLMSSLEFIGTWERINNFDFKVLDWKFSPSFLDILNILN